MTKRIEAPYEAAGPVRIGANPDFDPESVDGGALGPAQRQRRSVAHVELGEAPGHVGLDRLDADVEPARNLPIGQPFGHQLGDLTLGRGQRRRSGLGARPGSEAAGVQLGAGMAEVGLGPERVESPERSPEQVGGPSSLTLAAGQRPSGQLKPGPEKRSAVVGVTFAWTGVPFARPAWAWSLLRSQNFQLKPSGLPLPLLDDTDSAATVIHRPFSSSQAERLSAPTDILCRARTRSGRKLLSPASSAVPLLMTTPTSGFITATAA